MAPPSIPTDSMMPNSSQYLVFDNGVQRGPLSEPELVHAISTKAVSQSSFIWWEGQADWIPLAEKFSVPPLPPKTGPSLKEDRLYYFFEIAFWMFKGKLLARQIGFWILIISATFLLWNGLSLSTNAAQAKSLGAEINGWSNSSDAQESAVLGLFGDTSFKDRANRYTNQADNLTDQLRSSWQSVCFWSVILAITAIAKYISGFFKMKAYWKQQVR